MKDYTHTPHVLRATWRQGKHRLPTGEAQLSEAPEITLYTDTHLSRFADDSAIRFAVCETGAIVAGSARDVLHADMGLGSSAVGEGAALIAGVIKFYRGWWTVVYVQGFTSMNGGRNAKALLPRLSTWADFTDGERVHWREPGEMFDEMVDRLEERETRRGSE